MIVFASAPLTLAVGAARKLPPQNLHIILKIRRSVLHNDFIITKTANRRNDDWLFD